MKQPGHRAIAGRRHAITFAAGCAAVLLAPCPAAFAQAEGAQKYNTFPDPDFSDWIGEKYTESVHWSFDGGFYYFRLRAEL